MRPHVVSLYRGYVNMPLVPLSHSCTLGTACSVMSNSSNTLCSLSYLTIWQDSSRNADNRIFISRWDTHRTLSYLAFFHYYLRQGCSPPVRLCDSWHLFVFLLAKSFKKLWRDFNDMSNKYWYWDKEDPIQFYDVRPYYYYLYCICTRLRLQVTICGEMSCLLEVFVCSYHFSYMLQRHGLCVVRTHPNFQILTTQENW